MLNLQTRSYKMDNEEQIKKWKEEVLKKRKEMELKEMNDEQEASNDTIQEKMINNYDELANKKEVKKIEETEPMRERREDLLDQDMSVCTINLTYQEAETMLELVSSSQIYTLSRQLQLTNFYTTLFDVLSDWLLRQTSHRTHIKDALKEKQMLREELEREDKK